MGAKKMCFMIECSSEYISHMRVNVNLRIVHMRERDQHRRLSNKSLVEILTG